MEFRHLKYFIAVSEEQNIGRAAKRLNISQPPLTRQIKQLEDELSVELFVRTPRGVELTPAGALFLEEARNIGSIIGQAKERTQRAARGEIGRLDVAIFGSAILDAIPKMLLAFKEAHPGVIVQLHQMGKTEQIEALRQRRIDVGFNRLLKPLDDITGEQILRERLLIAVNAHHRLAQDDSIPLEAIAGDPLILFPSRGRPNFIDKTISMCNEAGFFPTIAQEVGDAVTSVALVASGFGICLVPQSLTSVAIPGVVYKPIRDARDHWVVDLSCIYRSGSQPAILQAFLKTVRSFRDECADGAPSAIPAP